MRENIWLCITNWNNWGIIKKEKVYGFNEQNKHYYDDLKIGDKVIIYVIPKRIGGLYKILNVNYKGNVQLPDGNYPYRIALKENLVPKELLDVTARTIGNLSIFKNSIRWGSVLMGRSILKLKRDDYSRVKRLIKDAETQRDS